MGKKATKAADNRYYLARSEAAEQNPDFSSREKAAEIIGIDRTRLARIELDTITPYPEEVRAMAKFLVRKGMSHRTQYGEGGLHRRLRPSGAESAGLPEGHRFPQGIPHSYLRGRGHRGKRASCFSGDLGLS